MSGPAYDAVVLAGGSARRLGGRDKPGELVGGVTLLERVLAGVPDAGRRIVVGPIRPVTRPVVWVREEPPGGGPVAGLAAGVAQVTAPLLVLLAADLPFVTATVVRRLIAAVTADGVLITDADGRDQPLLSAWRTDALQAAVDELPAPAGRPLRQLLGGLAVTRLSWPAEPGVPPVWLDCDTEAELQAARELA